MFPVLHRTAASDGRSCVTVFSSPLKDELENQDDQNQADDHDDGS